MPQSVLIERTAVIIPAYNVAAHIGDVIEKVRRIVPGERIIVVDDGSVDATHEQVRHRGVIVVRHTVNRGKGAALKSGIDEATRRGFEWVITLDADGQHDPEEIPRFIERASTSGADIVVGDRMSQRLDMPFIRVFANCTTSAFVSFRAGQRIPDSQNGYRLLRTAFVSSIQLETSRYDTESEILIKAARRGAHVTSVPVRTIYGNEKSGVNPFVDTLRFFRMALKSFFW